MNYQINKDIIVKSHNAAKSYAQPNQYFLNLLNSFQPVNYALDYGCGKGRYILPLLKKSKYVDAIDSTIQISRKQIIWGKSTSLLEWANEIQCLNVFPIESFNWNGNKYDLILNCNVLSAIPFEDDRIIVLENIKKALDYNGTAIITSQYRNSYFSTYENNPNAFKYNDGWIINTRGNYSFYGIIGKDKLLEYARMTGLKIDSVNLHDGSVYVSVKGN